MDKWIKKLLKHFNHDGWLFEETDDRYVVEYRPNIKPESIWLSRAFSLNELEMLVKHMKKYNKG